MIDIIQKIQIVVTRVQTGLKRGKILSETHGQQTDSTPVGTRTVQRMRN